MSQKMDAAEMLTVVAHHKEEKTEHAAEEDQHAAQQQRLKQELQLFNNNSSNGMAITITTNGFGVTAAAQSASQREHPRQQQQQSFYHKKTTKRVELAKRKARSELQKCGWQSMGYAFDTRWLDTRPEAGPDTIERVDASRMSYEQFVDRYERPGKPVILLGLTETWRANQRWNLPLLLRGYRNQKFKCGEDDDGYSVKLKMKYYVHYASTTQDDSPLYIFDSGFGDRPKTAKLLEDYEVPPMFKDDLFRYATDRRRPPHRWFVMGPARSGTAIHIDPLGTSAWNALVVGHKKWCLIHPTAPKLLVKPSRDESGPHPSEAVNWFNTVYRRVLSPQWPSDQFPVIHAVQAPGEVMFVPSGWWHVVMNLDSTIAVTQNFCSISNLPKVWLLLSIAIGVGNRSWYWLLLLLLPNVFAILRLGIRIVRGGGGAGRVAAENT